MYAVEDTPFEQAVSDFLTRNVERCNTQPTKFLYPSVSEGKNGSSRIVTLLSMIKAGFFIERN